MGSRAFKRKVFVDGLAGSSRMVGSLMIKVLEAMIQSRSNRWYITLKRWGETALMFIGYASAIGTSEPKMGEVRGMFTRKPTFSRGLDPLLLFLGWGGVPP